MSLTLTDAEKYQTKLYDNIINGTMTLNEAKEKKMELEKYLENVPRVDKSDVFKHESGPEQGSLDLEEDQINDILNSSYNVVVKKIKDLEAAAAAAPAEEAEAEEEAAAKKAAEEAAVPQVAVAAAAAPAAAAPAAAAPAAAASAAANKRLVSKRKVQTQSGGKPKFLNRQSKKPKKGKSKKGKSKKTCKKCNRRCR